MKHIFTGIVVLVFLFCGGLLYEYVTISNEAEQQVEADIKWLNQSFEDSALFLTAEHANKKYLQTKLIQQSVDSDNRFIRHYRSLFVREGNKSCLESLVRYQNYQPVLYKQTWVGDKPCF